MKRDFFGKKERIKICKHCNEVIDEAKFYEDLGNKFVCHKCSRFTEAKLANITEEEKTEMIEMYSY